MSTYSKAIGMVMQSVHVEFGGGNTTGNVLFTCGANEKIDFIPQVLKNNGASAFMTLQFELQVYNAQTNSWTTALSFGESNHQFPNAQLGSGTISLLPKDLGLTTTNCDRFVDGALKIYPNERVVYNTLQTASSYSMTYQLIKYSST